MITVRGRGCNLPWVLTNGQLKGWSGMSVMVVGSVVVVVVKEGRH